MLFRSFKTFAIAGFTVLLERKIIGRMEGEQALQFASYLGYNELKETIAKIGQDHTFTALIPDLSGGIDPDEAFSKVPYEKGSYFLYYLQVSQLTQDPNSALALLIWAAGCAGDDHEVSQAIF